MECVTVELQLKTGKNITVGMTGCIHRTLKSKVDTCIEIIQHIMKKISNTNKTIYRCDDYNLDFLNSL